MYSHATPIHKDPLAISNTVTSKGLLRAQLREMLISVSSCYCVKYGSDMLMTIIMLCSLQVMVVALATREPLSHSTWCRRWWKGNPMTETRIPEQPSWDTQRMQRNTPTGWTLLTKGPSEHPYWVDPTYKRSVWTPLLGGPCLQNVSMNTRYMFLVWRALI